MSWKGRCRSLLNRVLAPLGLTLVRTKDPVKEDRWGMPAALERMSRLVHEPGCIIDIGAASAVWSRMAKAYFPRAHFVLLEPLLERESELKSFCAETPGSHYRLAAAGDAEGKAQFDVSPDLDGSGFYGGIAGNAQREIPVTTVDAVVSELQLSGPFILKFDTHGFEVPILRGASTVLSSTSMIVMECYSFHVAPEAELFWEMCQRLRDLGFRPADLASPVGRHGDGAWWQSDILFLREDNAVFSRNTYR